MCDLYEPRKLVHNHAEIFLKRQPIAENLSFIFSINNLEKSVSGEYLRTLSCVLNHFKIIRALMPHFYLRLTSIN